MIMSAAENIWLRSKASRVNVKFEDNLSAKDIISRHTSKTERGLFIFNNSAINFHFAFKPLVNVIDAREQVNLIGLTN